MKNLLAVLAAGIALAAAPAAAEEIRVALPETLELAEIQPGLQVVTRLDLEVFSLDGAYWLRHDGRWFSSRRPAEGFQAADPRGVPPALARLERGRYLDYRPEAGQRVVQRQLGKEAAPERGGVEVDAGGARVAPRGTLIAPDRPAPPAERAAEPRPAPPAKAAPAAKKAPPVKKAPLVKKAPPAKRPPAKVPPAKAGTPGASR